MAVLPPELWLMVFKHLRRLYFLDKVRKLDASNLIHYFTVEHIPFIIDQWAPIYKIKLNDYHSYQIWNRHPPVEPDDIVVKILHECCIKKEVGSICLCETPLVIDARGNEIRDFYR